MGGGHCWPKCVQAGREQNIFDILLTPSRTETTNDESDRAFRASGNEPAGG
jgi:hypothetical protein